MMSAFAKDKLKLVKILKNAGIASGSVHKEMIVITFLKSKTNLPVLDQYYNSLIHFLQDGG